MELSYNTAHIEAKPLTVIVLAFAFQMRGAYPRFYLHLVRKTDFLMPSQMRAPRMLAMFNMTDIDFEPGAAAYGALHACGSTMHVP